jgi:hypothetical protein
MVGRRGREREREKERERKRERESERAFLSEVLLKLTPIYGKGGTR